MLEWYATLYLMMSRFVLRLGNSWRNVALLGILWRNVAFYENYGCSSYWSEGKTRPPISHKFQNCFNLSVSSNTLNIQRDFQFEILTRCEKNDVPVKGSRISTRKSTRKGRNLPSNQLFAGEIKDCSLWISHRINSCARLAEFGVLLGGGEFLRLWLLTVDRNTNETIGMFRRTLMSAKNRSFLELLFHASHNSKKRTFVNQSNHKYPTLHYSNNTRNRLLTPL